MQAKQQTTASGRDGFTLLEIIIAVAIIAVMAGALTPLVYRQLEAAREESTRKELDTLRGGLLEFYEDTGRMPTEAEGLVALATDPGVTGWQGPYVSGRSTDPATELGEDAWHNAYVYDVDPTTSPAGAADAIVASGGTDQTVTAGTVGGTWTIGGANDDLLAVTVTGPTDRGKTLDCQSEMELLAAAGRSYFRDHAAFPATGADLLGTYLDPGLGGTTFVDPWLMNYELSVDNTGANPPDWIVRSYGPNQTDEAGSGDDLTLVVSSVPPGRDTTRYKLEIAQGVLNEAPSQALTGAWSTTDRAALNLAVTFDTDGWGREFLVNVASRTIYSAGPDGDGTTTSDNIPTGMGP